MKKLHFTYHQGLKVSIKALESFISQIPAGMPFSIHTSNEVNSMFGEPEENSPRARAFEEEIIIENKESLRTVLTKLFRAINRGSRSWGDKNSIFCTAMTAFTLQEHGLPVTSPIYKEIIEYLSNNIKNASGEDIRLMLMTFSESYIEETDEVKQIYLSLLGKIEKNWISPDKAKTDSSNFYLQSKALKTAKDNSVIYDYSRVEKEIASINPGDNPALLASCLLWGRKVSVSEKLKSQLLQMLPSSKGFINDLIIKDILFYSGKKAEARKVMSEKFQNLKSGKLSYELDKKFSEQEKAYLKIMLPSFINGSYFTNNEYDDLQVEEE